MFKQLPYVLFFSVFTLLNSCSTLRAVENTGNTVVHTGSHLVVHTGVAVGKTVGKGLSYVSGQPVRLKGH